MTNRTPIEEILRRNGVFPEAEERAYQEAKDKFIAEVKGLNRKAKEAAEEEADLSWWLGLVDRGGKKGKNCE